MDLLSEGCLWLENCDKGFVNHKVSCREAPQLNIYFTLNGAIIFKKNTLLYYIRHKVNKATIWWGTEI